MRQADGRVRKSVDRQQVGRAVRLRTPPQAAHGNRPARAVCVLVVAKLIPATTAAMDAASGERRCCPRLGRWLLSRLCPKRRCREFASTDRSWVLVDGGSRADRGKRDGRRRAHGRTEANATDAACIRLRRAPGSGRVCGRFSLSSLQLRRCGRDAVSIRRREAGESRGRDSTTAHSFRRRDLPGVAACSAAQCRRSSI